MQYVEFMREVESLLADIDLCKDYLERFLINPDMCYKGLEVLNQYKGDDPAKGHILILKDLVRELNLQTFFLKQDFRINDIKHLKEFHFKGNIEFKHKGESI